MSTQVSVPNRANQHGFTLIELVFAVAAFSIMLTVAVSGLLNAMFIYNQSNVSRDNQQQARTIMDTIGRDIRSAQKATALSSGTQLCLNGTPDGDILYFVSPDKKLKRQPAKSDCSGTLGGSAAQILTTPGIVVVDSISPPTSGLKVTSYIQPAGSAGATPQQTVQVILSLGRNLSTTPSVRARQFSNQFRLQSTYLVRGSGG